MLVTILLVCAVTTGVVAVAVIVVGRRHAVAAAQLLDELRNAAAPSLEACRGWNGMVAARLEAAVRDGHWVSRDTRTDWERRRPTPSAALKRLADDERAGADARKVLTDLDRDLRPLVDQTNARVRVRIEARFRSFFSSIESQPLTDEQTDAVVTFDNRVQVVAAAGSGKTSVMVARAAYAIKRDLVPADRVLLLAFNADAAEELQERVEARLEAAGIDATGLSASTFHSFGLKVIGRATQRKPRLASWLGEKNGDVAMVSRIVDDLRDRSPEFRIKWDLYRLLFARMADSPAGGTPDSYDYDSKQTGFRTFNGETVKSQGERLIADFLFLNGVKYEYERPYVADVATPERSQYRPDFYYPDADVWHEHWALDRNGRPPADFKGYADGMLWKKAIHRQHGTTLIETTWASIIDQTGFEPLTAALAEHGLELDWNPDRPISGANPVKHEDLARLMRSFMAHVKSNSLTRRELDRRLAAATGLQKYRARVFLDLYWDVHEEWQACLKADDAVDFEDMLVRAAEHLEAGDVDMGYDLVLVDEFQDASRARARLTKALIDKPHRYLLAVGDDWQSINRFAGADLSVMTSFNKWFGEGPTLRLQKTFRSPQSICDTAAEFVAKNPRQFKKTVKSDHVEYGPVASLIRVESVDEIPLAIADFLAELAARVRDREVEPGRSGVVEVDVLGRYNFDRDTMPRRTPPDLKVEFRTVHRSKGLEADYVIIPNLTAGTYGFPSEVVDDPVLSLAMTDADPFPNAEERRLFYVALTRARRHVALIGVKGRESTFIAELLKAKRLELSPLSTVGLSEPCPTCGRGTLVVRRNRTTGIEFWGCTAFPACRYTRSTS